MSLEQLQIILENLHQQYRHQAPAGTPQGLAFEIHNFATQTVVDASGIESKFNDVVLTKVTARNQGKEILSFEAATKLIQDAMKSMQAENAERKAKGQQPHHSNYLNEEVLKWAIDCQGDASDRNAFQQVVTMLQNTPEKLETWLSGFLEESANAYSSNGQSCVKGVKERVITSVRNVMQDDKELSEIFAQAESKKLLQTKLTSLNKMDVWAKKLFEVGVKSTTSEVDAKKKYEELLNSYFAASINDQNSSEIKANIEAALESFSDSEIELNGTKQKEEGAWNKMFKPLLAEFETGRITLENHTTTAAANANHNAAASRG